MTSRSRPHASSGPEPVRCTDCGSWRLTGQDCTTCWQAIMEVAQLPAPDSCPVRGCPGVDPALGGGSAPCGHML